MDPRAACCRRILPNELQFELAQHVRYFYSVKVRGIPAHNLLLAGPLGVYLRMRWHKLSRYSRLNMLNSQKKEGAVSARVTFEYISNEGLQNIDGWINLSTSEDFEDTLELLKQELQVVFPPTIVLMLGVHLKLSERKDDKWVPITKDSELQFSVAKAAQKGWTLRIKCEYVSSIGGPEDEDPSQTEQVQANEIPPKLTGGEGTSQTLHVRQQDLETKRTQQVHVDVTNNVTVYVDVKFVELNDRFTLSVSEKARVKSLRVELDRQIMAKFPSFKIPDRYYFFYSEKDTTKLTGSSLISKLNLDGVSLEARTS